MTLVQRYYQLVIRNAADTADDLVVTSVPTALGGTNPYIVEPPDGDGQSLDPLTGKFDVGAYRVSVADAIVGGVRLVTSKLSDPFFRTAILSRRAYVKTATASAGPWTILVPGWVLSCRLADAITYEVTIGESLRLQDTTNLFKTLTPQFPIGTELFGGPVRGGFANGRALDLGGWRFKVRTVAGDVVTLDFVSGHALATGDSLDSADGPVTQQFETLPPTSEWRRIENAAAPYRQAYGAFSAQGMGGIYPQLRALVLTLAGVVKGEFLPLGVTDSGRLLANARLNLLWPAAGLDATGAVAAAQPAVGTLFDIYVHPISVSESFPVHIDMHPVDAAAAIFDQLGDAVDPVSQAAVREAVGASLRFLGRVRAPMKARELLEQLYAFFGFASRMDVTGKRVFVRTRLRSSALPSQTITLNDLRDPDGAPFDVEEKSILNLVSMSVAEIDKWRERPDAPPAEPADGLFELPVRFEVEDPRGSIATLGERTLSITLPGEVALLQGNFYYRPYLNAGAYSPDLSPFLSAIGQEVFNRAGAGVPGGTFHCLHTVTAQVGDEVILDLPHQVNLGTYPATRGGQRIVQVTQRTETPEGPDLVVSDVGSSAQLATAPVFTLALWSADPQHVGQATLTNAATLVTQDSRVRVEIATGTTAPTDAGAPLVSFDPAHQTTVLTPRLNAGTRLWLRMRSERDDQRPSVYTAWQSLDLTALATPTSLTALQIDPRTVDLSWALTDTTTPVEISWRATATDPTRRLLITLPAGSTTYRAEGLVSGAAYEFGVQLREASPLAGTSASATVTITTSGTIPTLPAPVNPRAFSGRVGTSGTRDFTNENGIIIDGTFGLEVEATVIPSTVEFEVAVETAVGSGVAGTFARVDALPAVHNDFTTWTGRAPSDGKLRYLRARHTGPGFNASAYTSVVSVDPWSAVAAIDAPVPVPTVSFAAVRDGTPGSSVSYVQASFTPPATLGRMEYDVESRPAGASTFRDAVRVPGTQAGPDRIETAFNTELRITPITVSKYTATRNSGTPVIVAVGPNPAAEIVSITAVRGTSYVDFTITVDEDFVRGLFWLEERVTNPGSGTEGIGPDVSSPTQPVFAEVNRRSLDSLGRITLRGDLGDPSHYACLTGIPFDRIVEAGTPASYYAQGNAAATSPSAPASAAFGTPTSSTVPVVATMPGALGSPTPTRLRLFRNGILVQDDALTAAGGGTQTITETGLTPGTTYGPYAVALATAGGVESTRVAVTPSSSTATPAATVPTPTLAGSRTGPNAILTITPGGGTPGSATFDVEADDAAGGAFVVIDTGVTQTSAIYHLPSNTRFRVKAFAAGWSPSAYSNIVTP
jgi:hypothetical protein